MAKERPWYEWRSAISSFDCRLRVVMRKAASLASVPLLVKKTLFSRGGVIVRNRSASSIWERIRKSVLEWMMRSSCSLIGSLISGMA